MAQSPESGAQGLGESAGGGGSASGGGAPGCGGDPKKPISAAAIGRDWGTSRQYAAEQIKKGCPTDSLEAARKWREEHAKYGIGYRSKAGAPLHKGDPPAPEPEPAAAEPPPPAQTQKAPAPLRVLGAYDFSTLEGSLAAAIAIEQEAFAMVSDAIADPKRASAASVLIQNYNKARDGRMEAEKRVQELKEAEEKVVPVDKAKEMIRRVLVPLLTRLRTVSKRAGFKANPTNDIHAESIIREEIETAIGEARLEFAS